MGHSSVNLEQGSKAWLEFRRGKRPASESAAVMGLSPWVSPYQLWEIRTGRRVVEENSAMRRGTELEPIARAHWERVTGQIWQPMVMVDGEYSASLDGLNLDGTELTEIKCPVKGKESETWKAVEAGSCPEHYRLQVIHQLHVSAASKGHFMVFDGEDHIALEILPDPVLWDEIRGEWDKFMECIKTDTPPALTEKDVVERDDLYWQIEAFAYISAKAEVDAATAKLEAAKARLLEQATHTSERGFGVQVTRFWKRGSVDYKRVPELAGIDLDAYRAAAKQETRITLTKGQ